VAGSHGTAGANYLAGQYQTREYRNFFIFDLSSVAGLIVSASCCVESAPLSSAGALLLALADGLSSCPCRIASRTFSTAGCSFGLANSSMPSFAIRRRKEAISSVKSWMT